MTIDQNGAFSYLCDLANKYANLKTKKRIWNELINLFAGANGQDRLDACNSVDKEFSEFKDSYFNFKDLCSFQPDEEEHIKKLETFENPYVIGEVYQEFMSME